MRWNIAQEASILWRFIENSENWDFRLFGFGEMGKSLFPPFSPLYLFLIVSEVQCFWMESAGLKFAVFVDSSYDTSCGFDSRIKWSLSDYGQMEGNPLIFFVLF